MTLFTVKEMYCAVLPKKLWFPWCQWAKQEVIHVEINVMFLMNEVSNVKRFFFWKLLYLMVTKMQDDIVQWYKYRSLLIWSSSKTLVLLHANLSYITWQCWQAKLYTFRVVYIIEKVCIQVCLPTLYIMPLSFFELCIYSKKFPYSLQILWIHYKIPFKASPSPGF